MTLYPLNFQTYAYGRLQNNLFLGGPSKGERAEAVQVVPGQRTRLNHNGYLMSNAKFLYDEEVCRSFGAFQEVSGLGEGGIGVDFSDFVRAASPHGLQREWPHNIKLLDPEKIDLRLADGSEAIDAGVVIPNVNEDFTGDAPDLGAYEHGKPLPHYGPRCEFPEPYRMREPNGTKPPDGRLLADPGDVTIRVACGSPWPYEDPAGRVWQGDRKYRYPRPWGFVGNPNAWHDQRGRGSVGGTPLTQLYRFERAALDAYIFTVPPGGYAVRLHWIERWGAGRVFDVTINNRKVLDDFEIFDAAGGNHRPISRKFPVKVRGNTILIEFERESGGTPMLNGIEIFRTDEHAKGD